MNPKVSFIIPFHNSEHSLRQSIESVFAQTHDCWEMILIDDGSTDGSLELAQSFGDRAKVLQQANQGQGAARNLGLSHSTGDFVAFLDADDEFKPRFAESCIEFLKEHPDCVAVNTSFEVLQQDNTIKVFPNIAPEDQLEPDAWVLPDFFEFWAQYDHVRTGTCLIRMSTIKKAGGQQAHLRISQDLEYWALIATHGQWGFIVEPHWIGKSSHHASKSGWFKKYVKRRRLCPSVEQWHERVLPRLSEEQLEHFKVVRGRVAANFVQSKLIAGHTREAWEIYDTYRSELPQNKLVRFLNGCCRFGWPGRGFARFFVYYREWIKSCLRKKN